MKIAVYIIAALLAVLGVTLAIGAGQGKFATRMAIAVVLLAAAGALIALSRLRPQHHHHRHELKVDMPGDTSLEQVQCKQCGAELSSRSVDVAAGAVFIRCEYCGAEYQLEEAPKW